MCWPFVDERTFWRKFGENPDFPIDKVKIQFQFQLFSHSHTSSLDYFNVYYVVFTKS